MPDASQLAGTIVGDFYGDRFDLSARKMPPDSAWSLMPEVEAKYSICGHSLPDRSTRIFLTLVSALDRARDSTRLWRTAATLFRSQPGAFDPAVLSSVPSDSLVSMLSASGVSQRHGPDAQAWRRISESLASGFGAVSRLVDTGNGNAAELFEDLCSSDKDGASRYPLLRGPKVGPVWVRIMSHPGGANIEQIETIPVAVDVHTRRVTENLGISQTHDLQLPKVRSKIQAAWRDAVARRAIGGPAGVANTCAALDPALWFFGKYGCSHCERGGYKEPISVACRHCRLPASPVSSN